MSEIKIYRTDAPETWMNWAKAGLHAAANLGQMFISTIEPGQFCVNMDGWALQIRRAATDDSILQAWAIRGHDLDFECMHLASVLT